MTTTPAVDTLQAFGAIPAQTATLWDGEQFEAVTAAWTLHLYNDHAATRTSLVGADIRRILRQAPVQVLAGQPVTWADPQPPAWLTAAAESLMAASR